ncbi:MAG TPA: caspase family protein [Pyrinomonadaceae bacterium]
MAHDDGYYAIIVGIKYADQELNTLRGPENDAESFYKWVVSSEGGGVHDDEQHCRLILSSRFGGAAEPTAARVVGAFEAFDRIAAKNADEGRRRHVGKRLYIYLAGHGFAPSNLDEETGLLVADAKSGDYQQHVLGRYCAHWAYKAYYFDEILLFMDCCRTPLLTNPVLNYKPREVNAADYEKVRRLYCFACKWSYKAREREMPPNNAWHGVFTTALLEGLHGAAADSKGRVTADSLYRYLKNFTQCYMSPEERDDQSVPKEPDIFYEPEHGTKIVITTVKKDGPGIAERLGRMFAGWMGFTPPSLKGYAVEIALPEDAAGRKFEVLDGKLNPVASVSAGAEQPSWKLELEPGFYAVTAEDDPFPKLFAVGCGGTVHVDLNA